MAIGGEIVHLLFGSGPAGTATIYILTDFVFFLPLCNLLPEIWHDL